MIRIDGNTLKAALIGYDAEIVRMRAEREQVRQRLEALERAAVPDGQPRRRMSAAARKRIAEAQRARWAQYRKGKK